MVSPAVHTPVPHVAPQSAQLAVVSPSQNSHFPSKLQVEMGVEMDMGGDWGTTAGGGGETLGDGGGETLGDGGGETLGDGGG